MDSVSLAFVPSHSSGMGGIGYAGKGDSLSIVSCGQGGQLCIHKPGDPSDKTTTSMQAEGVSCHCLAVNPDQNSFAVGDQGHFVKVQHYQRADLRNKGARACILQPKRAHLIAYHPEIVWLLQIYRLPGGDFDSVATRFSLPVRALAYSPSGTNLAASGDDEGIKLISAAESKVPKLLTQNPQTSSV